MKSSAPASSASARSASKYSRGVEGDGRRVGLTPQLPDEAQPVQPRAAAHMLGPKVGGFMGAEDAMNNAYADLRRTSLA